MHNRLHYLMVVGQGLILPLFPGCNKDEPIFGKLDIDYVDINSDAKLFYEFVCHKDLLIQHAQKITSKTFTNTHIEETINKQELGQFITELEELNRKADEYLEAFRYGLVKCCIAVIQCISQCLRSGPKFSQI